MSTPQQNPAMYDAGDVTKNLESFKVHDFLLIHGNADDNVHFQQSMALARALQKEDIYFEQMVSRNTQQEVSDVLASNHQ